MKTIKSVSLKSLILLNALVLGGCSKDETGLQTSTAHAATVKTPGSGTVIAKTPSLSKSDASAESRLAALPKIAASTDLRFTQPIALLPENIQASKETIETRAIRALIGVLRTAKENPLADNIAVATQLTNLIEHNGVHAVGTHEAEIAKLSMSDNVKTAVKAVYLAVQKEGSKFDALQGLIEAKAELPDVFVTRAMTSILAVAPDRVIYPDLLYAVTTISIDRLLSKEILSAESANATKSSVLRRMIEIGLVNEAKKPLSHDQTFYISPPELDEKIDAGVMAGASPMVRSAVMAAWDKVQVPLASPALVKGEFETTADFQKREADAVAELRAGDASFLKFQQYNFKTALKMEIPKVVRWRAADLQYNADTQTLTGTIKGQGTDLAIRLTMPVPIDQAPAVKAGFENAPVGVLYSAAIDGTLKIHGFVLSGKDAMAFAPTAWDTQIPLSRTASVEYKMLVTAAQAEQQRGAPASKSVK